MYTIQDMLDKQGGKKWRALELEDLDIWALAHEWLLVEQVELDDINIKRHYLTPIGNELHFSLQGLNAKSKVYYDGRR